MALTIPRDVVSTIVTAVVYRPDGASLREVIAGFPTPPTRAQAQHWLAALVEAEILELDATATPHRYYATDAAAEYVGGADAVPPPPNPTSANPASIAAPTAPSAPVPAEGQPTDAIPPKPPVLPADASTQPANATPEFSVLFADVLTSIVVGALPRAAAMSLLQNAAARAYLDVSKRRPFVAYGLDRLAHLTLGECLRQGMEPEQYELWRRQYSSAPDSVPANRVRKTPGTTSAPDADPASMASDSVASESIEPPGPVSRPTARRRRAEAVNRALRSDSPPSASMVAKQVAAWVSEHVPGGGNPVIRWALFIAAAALVAGVSPLVFQYPWALAVVALAVVAIAILFAPAGTSLRTDVRPGEGSTDDAHDAAGAPGNGTPSRTETSTPSAVNPGGAPAQTGATGGRWAVLRGVPRQRLLLAIGCLALIVGIVGTHAYLQARRRPSTARLSDELIARFAPLPVRVTGLELTSWQPGAASCRLMLQAAIETTEPLFQRVDSEAYLNRQAAAEMSAIRTADALLRGPNGDRLRRAVGAPAPTPDVDDLVLLTTKTPPGTVRSYSGVLQAWRRNGDWVFTADEARIDRQLFDGDPRPPGASSFAVDMSADSARLRSLLAAHAAYAAKVQRAAVGVAADADRERQQQADRFAQLLDRGVVFTGSVADPAQGDGQRITFEIVESSGDTRRVSAVLRNDGGWSDGRRYTGAWSIGEADGICTLTLRTRAEDRVAGAGPLLDDNHGRVLTLRVRADGSAADDTGEWQLRRVAPAGVEAVKTASNRPIATVLECTQVGKVYRGTVVARGRPTTELLVLRFTEQSPDGAVLQATLESTTMAGWVRPFRGTIVGNTYRAGGTPIRLRSADADRIREAPPRSLLGLNTSSNSLVLGLRVDGTRLVGSDDRFEYEFEPVDPASVTPVPRPSTAAAQTPSPAGQPAPSPAASAAASTAGSVAASPARSAARSPASSSATSSAGWSAGPLAASGANSAATSVAASVADYPAGSSVGSDAGSDPSPAAMAAPSALASVARTGAASADAAAATSAPNSAVRVAETTVTSTPAQQPETAVAGASPTLVFASSAVPTTAPAAVAATASLASPARTEAGPNPAVLASSSNAQTAASNLPPYPKNDGAYVLTEGRWTPLARNERRAMQNTAKTVTSLLGALERWGNASLGQRAEISANVVLAVTFESSAAVPTIRGKDLVMLYVGSLSPLGADKVAQYPELRAYPIMEIAAVDVLANGIRQVPLVTIVPGVTGFGARRITAIIEQPATGITLLRSTAPLAPGRYALSAGAQNFEVAVE
jgi:hypothetical protein